MLRPRIKADRLDTAVSGIESDIADFVTGAMSDTTSEVKEVFRDQVRAAGLGSRLPNSIRSVVYPNRGGRKSLNPTGWIYAQPSKDGRGAAAIIDSYANGRMIYATNGRRRLAIPSDDCPRKRNGQAFTTQEVEAKYGRRLIEIDPKDKGFRTPSIRKSGTAYLVMKGLVVRKATGRWRNASQRELEGRTRNPRPVQMVIMFTLVRMVRKQQSIDLSVPEAVAESRFTANLDRRWR